jgi:Carboxypeptidase regulatory-like domain/TonB dependent receptor
MRSTYGFFFAALMLIGLLAGSRAYGQGGATGAISGSVVDTSGGSVAGADVQIIDTRTEVVARKLPTGSDGSFVATLLPPATYSVVVNKSGFSQAKADGIEVRVTETTKVTITLKPGSVSERVEISAQITTVDTTNATTGQSLGTETVRELPLATQNFQQLLTLSSGAQSELNNSTQLGRGDVRMIVNGQREDNNNYLIEGISSTDYNVAELTNTPLPNPDVIQEFKVQTSLYDASQGRNGGGNINAVLKSGTKQFHGDAYEFFRNDKLDANDYFLNASGQKRPVVRQNLFGFSFGGPAVTQRLGFFFVNYQGTRQRSGLSPGTIISTTIPVLPADRSAANLASVFSSPATGKCAAQAITIDPVAANLLSLKSDQFGGTSGGFLFPTVPGTPKVNVDPTTCSTSANTGTFTFSKPGRYTDDQFTANWDREFHGGNDKIAERFFYSNSETFEPFGAGGLQASLGGAIAASDLNFPYTLPVRDRFLGITETHLFSPNLVNELRFGLVHINNSSLNTAPAGATASALGINRPTNNLTDNMYKFTFNTSGFQFGPTPQADQHQEQNNYNFIDTVSWVHGSHVLRVGGEMTFVNLFKLFPQVFNGQLFFSSASGGLSDFQSFLEGAPTGSFGGGGVFNHQYKQDNFAAFAQDDWKVTKNTTLNLGLRTEFLGAWLDGLCHIGNLESDLTLTGVNPFVYPGCVNTLGVAGLSGSGNGTTFHNRYSTGLGPRIGVAYDVFGKHTTTVRAGYGIYYVREDIGAVDQLSFQAPFIPIAGLGGLPGSLANFFEPCSNPPPQNPWCSSTTFGMTNPNALPAAGVLSPSFVGCGSVLQGFVVSGTTTTTFDSSQSPVYANQAGCNGVGAETIFVLEVPRHFRVPSTQQWNLTVQRSLGKQWVLEVGYVGTHGTHLRDTRDAIESLDATVTPVHVTDVNGHQYTITTDTLSNAIARTPTPGLNGYGGYQVFANDAYSHYHSLQTTLSRRWSQGYLQAAYTWSKSTDATSTGNPAFNTAFNNESTLNDSRGLSDFDRPQRLVVSYVYDLPFLRNASGALHTIAGGWQISGVTTFQSGLPFSIFDTASGTAFILNGSTSTLSADLAPGATIAGGYSKGDIHTRLNGYLNPNNFATVPVLPANQALCATDPNYCVIGFGNLGRNIYRGPHQQNWDFSLIKNFKLTERQALRFSTDFFNLWNHANFANPAVTDVETIGGAFGKIVSTRGVPRLIQFSLRYAF